MFSYSFDLTYYLVLKRIVAMSLVAQGRRNRGDTGPPPNNLHKYAPPPPQKKKNKIKINKKIFFLKKKSTYESPP